MKKTKRFWAVFFLAAVLPALAGAQRKPVKEILKQVDDLYRGKTSAAELEMTVETTDWKRTLDLKAWSEGMDKTFIVILAPKKDAGIATLRVKKEMWNFFPRINKTLKVPPSMMMGSWMGSDFTNDDLVKESTLIDDYNARWLKDDAGPAGTWTMELIPKAETATVWGKILLSVLPGTVVPVEEDYFDEHGEKVRILKFTDVQKVEGRDVPMRMELASLKKPGNRTSMRYKTLQFDVPLAPSVFSLQNLRQAR